MNKLFQKIAGAALGLTMAIGVGVAVASNSKEATPVHAASATYNKVTSAPSSWSGTYLIGSPTKGWVMKSTNVADSTSNYTSDSKFSANTDSVTGDYSAYEFTVTSYSTGYTIAATTGNYIYGGGSGSNKLNIGTTQYAGTFSFTSKNEIDYTANGGYLRANDRFRFYKASTYTSSAAVTLYKKAATTYTVTYDKNAGSDTVTGMPSSATGVEAGSFTLSTAEPSRTGYTFLGWGETADATQTVTSITISNSNRTVYAIWQLASTPSVTVSPTETSGYRGQTQLLTAAPNAYITPTSYTWTSSNTNVVKFEGSNDSSVIQSGTNMEKITIVFQGDSSASATISVTATDGNVTTSAAECAVTVSASSHSLTLSPSTAQSVSVGSSVSVTATSNGSGAYSSVNITATTGDASKVKVDGGTTATKSSGSSFSISGVAQGSTTVTFTTTNGDTESLTVTVTPPEKDTIYGKYQLCTSTDDLVENGHYIIGSSKDDGSNIAFMSTEVKTSNIATFNADISNSQVTLEQPESGYEVMVLRLEGSTGAWKFWTKNASSNGYLKNADSGTSNNLLVDSATDRTFTISFNASNHATEPFAAVITATSGSGRNLLRKNSSSALFACYGSGQSPVYLYKQIDEVAISSITIPSTYGGTGSEFYEGQNWTVSPTYNSDATTKTSEIVVLTNSSYVDVDGYTISAKTGVIPSSTATVTFKMHATDVAQSTVYSNVCTITITKATVTKVEVTTAPTDVSYVEGQTLDLAGMVTTLTWNYGVTTTLSGAASGLTTTPSLSTSLTVADHNGAEVLVTYAGITTDEGDGFTISVIAKAVANNGLSWSGMTTSYGTDGTFIADGSLTVTWNDDTQDTFNVATLYASGDVTFKIGDAENTAVAILEGDSLSSENNGQKVFLYFGGHYTSQSITVREINIQFLTRVTSTSDLVAGETYIIAAKHGSTTYVMTSDVVSKPAAIEWDDAWSDEFEVNSVKYPIDSLRADIATYGWTLGGQEDAWTWTAADGDSLAYSSGTNFNSTGTATWKIGVSGRANSGYWKISNTSSTDRVVTFREGTTMAFAPYSNSNPQGNTDGTGEYHYVELYRVLDVENTTLETWADTISYIDELNCVASGSYSFNEEKSWSTMAEAFDDLDLEVKAYIRHASYTYNGSTTTATNATNSNVAEFVCKYDYVVDKYGWTDFIGRNGTDYDLFNSASRITVLNIINGNTNTIAVIVIISLVSVTAVGGYFFLRKREED